jgi:hypothetical protein
MSPRRCACDCGEWFVPRESKVRFKSWAHYVRSGLAKVHGAKGGRSGRGDAKRRRKAAA